MVPVNFRSLDLNLLRVFDEVMAERSLTRAAHKLSLTQPAVSNALRRLREVLGDDLVVRSGHGVEPTQRALALWPPVREALAQLQESLAPGLFEPTTATSTFVLAMSDATAATLVPGLVEMKHPSSPQRQQCADRAGRWRSKEAPPAGGGIPQQTPDCSLSCREFPSGWTVFCARSPAHRLYIHRSRR